MSSYAVVKRMSEDRVYLPGEVLVDPPNAGTLMERGFLVPVPDNFVAPTDHHVRVRHRRTAAESGEAEPESGEPEETKTGQEPGQDAGKDAGEETKKAKLPKKIDLSKEPEPKPEDLPETQVGA